MRTLPKLPRPLSPGERPFTGPTWPDAWIEAWAAVYLEPEANRALRASGVRFETFLRAPVEILDAVRRSRTFQGRPVLLPAQRVVQARMDLAYALAEIADAETRRIAAEAHCSNGRVVEKLRHHAHPRSGHRDFHPAR